MKAIRFVLFLLPMICLSVNGYALQNQSSQPSDQNSAGPVPQKVVSLFNDISDIDKLRVLNPLDLTADQISQLITLINKEQDAYNKRLAAVAVPPVDAIAQDIKKVKAKMLKGGIVPQDFDSRVKQLQTDFIKQRAAEDNRTLASMIAGAKKILTTEQVRSAVIEVKALTKFAPDTTDDEYFNFYVLGTFVVYPRIVPLLKEMEQARTGSSATAPASGPTPAKETAQ